MEYLVNCTVEMFVLWKPFPKIIKTVYHKYLYLQMFLLGNFYYVVAPDRVQKLEFYSLSH